MHISQKYNLFTENFVQKVPVERCPHVGHDSYPPSRLIIIFSRCGRDIGNQTVLLTGTFVLFNIIIKYRNVPLLFHSLNFNIISNK